MSGFFQAKKLERINSEKPILQNAGGLPWAALFPTAESDNLKAFTSGIKEIDVPSVLMMPPRLHLGFLRYC